MAYQIYWHTHVRRGSVFRLTDGRMVRIVNPGLLNTDSGPDFFNAAVEIDGCRWQGNIEIHLSSSDWYRHGHHSDPAYSNVVLHVVGSHDKEVEVAGNPVPTVILPLSQEYLHSYKSLRSIGPGLKCAGRLENISSLARTEWLDVALTSRMREKGARILELLDEFGGDWHQAFLCVLARALGFGLNAEPFEVLARSLPLNYARRHTDDIFQLEALFFGQSGLLSVTPPEAADYFYRLRNEYSFLAYKYTLYPAERCGWKLARTRPANFPHRRIALLARYCADIDTFFSRTIDARGDTDVLRHIYSLAPSPFWHTHYSFATTGDNAGRSAVNLSAASLALIYINAVAPLYFAYAMQLGRYEYIDYATEMLDILPAESNNIIRTWALAGIKASCASDSQALLYLRRNYCDERKCHLCRWGQKIFLHP